MILPYIALAATGLPAAYRTRAFLRLAIVYQVVMTCDMAALESAVHVWWPGSHVYYWIWTVAEPVGVALFAVAVLKRCRPPWTPLYGFLAFGLYALTLTQPRQWQSHPYLQPEINVVGLCWLLLGLLVVHTSAHEPVPRLLPLAALFLTTGASYLAAAWGYEAIVESMWMQSGCYLWIASAGDTGQSSHLGVPRAHGGRSESL